MGARRAAGRLRGGLGAAAAVLRRAAGLKGIFNIGAGVDALMKLQLAAGVPVVRLDDAGMSAQMAEYVSHAVIRHFRELDGYEADIAAANGLTASRRARAISRSV